MGKLVYGAPTWTAEFDDRSLAHLRIVMIAKLRRGESFSFSWKYEAAHGAGRSSLWVHPAIPLQFEFFGGREPALEQGVDRRSDGDREQSGRAGAHSRAGNGDRTERRDVARLSDGPSRRRDG